MTRSSVLVVTLSLMLATCSPSDGTGPTVASGPVPETRRVDHVDDFFGQEVADPYRWLEDRPGLRPRTRYRLPTSRACRPVSRSGRVSRRSGTTSATARR